MSALSVVRRVVLLGLLLGFGVSTARAARDPRDYPLRLHIFMEHWNGSERGGYNGYGRANLLDGHQANAVEFAYLCDFHPLYNNPNEAYGAKWKRPGKSIELIVGVLGSPGKYQTCELKLDIKDFVYDPVAGSSKTLTQAEFWVVESKRAARESAMNPEDTDPANYKVRISVLRLTWSERVGGMNIGNGQGNLLTPDGPVSVDFTMNCPLTFPTNAEGRSYPAQWKHEGSELVLLLHKNLDPTSVATCELKTRLNRDVYVLSSENVVKAVSREEYKRMKAAQARPEPAPQ